MQVIFIVVATASVVFMRVQYIDREQLVDEIWYEERLNLD